MATFGAVINGATPTTGEQAIINAVVALGHTFAGYGQDTAGTRAFTPAGGGATVPISSVGFVLICPDSLSGSGVTNWVTDINAQSKPVFSMFHSSWDDLGLQVATAGVSSTAITTTDLQDHPIVTLAGFAAGQTKTYLDSAADGQRVIGTASNNLGTGNVAIVGYAGGLTSSCVMVALDAGDVPASGTGTVPARRAAFGPTILAFDNLTADGQALFGAGVNWVSGQNPSVGDTTDPSITLMLPSPDDQVNQTLTLRASASDNVALKATNPVWFNIDGGTAIYGTLVGDFYENTYDASGLSQGAHTVTATAEDTSGNTTTTAAVTFNVDHTVTEYKYLGATDINDLYRGAAGLLVQYLGITPLAPVIDTPGGGGGSTPPATSSFGPNGTHWYRNTALEGEAANTHEVAATWAAIGNQITACASHTGACEILVQPGTLAAGGGSGSTTSGVLNNIGSTSKTQRTLVRPRDGYGTVTIASTTGTGTALVGVHNVVFHKIDFFNHPAINMRNSVGLSIGYTKIKRLLSTANGGSGVVNNELVEVVLGPEQANAVEFDRSEFKTSSGYTMNGFRKVGVYLAPHYKPEGSSAHCDTMQYEAVNGGGLITNIEHEDLVMFRSADQGVQAAGTHFKAIKHSLYLGKNQSLDRYPMYAGGDPMTLDNVLNGSATVDLIVDTIVGGNIANWTFTTLQGTNKSESGHTGFTTDAGMSSWGTAELDALSTYPSDAYLASIWT